MRFHKLGLAENFQSKVEGQKSRSSDITGTWTFDVRLSTFLVEFAQSWIGN